MKNRCSAPYPLSKLRAILLVLNYFVGYNMVYPAILTKLTLAIDPTANMIPEWMQLIVYLWMILFSVILAWPLLQESYWGFQQHKRKLPLLMLKLVGLYYLCSMGVNLMIMLISSTPTSANQSQVISAISIAPMIAAFSTILYAPIVEEIVFRGVFFRFFRSHLKFWQAALISGLTFGFLHVMDSFFMGNYADLVYLLSYGVIGIFLSLAYEKSESIYGGMILHFINNTVAFSLLMV